MAYFKNIQNTECSVHTVYYVCTEIFKKNYTWKLTKEPVLAKITSNTVNYGILKKTNFLY